VEEPKKEERGQKMYGRRVINIILTFQHVLLVESEINRVGHG